MLEGIVSLLFYIVVGFFVLEIAVGVFGGAFLLTAWILSKFIEKTVGDVLESKGLFPEDPVASSTDSAIDDLPWDDLSAGPAFFVPKLRSLPQESGPLPMPPEATNLAEDAAVQNPLLPEQSQRTCPWKNKPAWPDLNAPMHSDPERE